MRALVNVVLVITAVLAVLIACIFATDSDVFKDKEEVLSSHLQKRIVDSMGTFLVKSLRDSSHKFTAIRTVGRYSTFEDIIFLKGAYPDLSGRAYASEHVSGEGSIAVYFDGSFINVFTGEREYAYRDKLLPLIYNILNRDMVAFYRMCYRD